MAVTGPVEAGPEPSGFLGKFRATLKRITPGEWALIGIGIVGLVVYFIWYRGQQASSSAADALVPASGSSNPSWGSAQADPYGTYQSELTDLINLLQSGALTVPGTSSTTTTTTSGGSGGGGSKITGTTHPGSSSGASGTTTASTTIARASSGSNVTHANSNQAPVHTATQVIYGTHTPGVQVTTPAGKTVAVPANVTSHALSSGGPSGGNVTAGSEPATHVPAGVRKA